MKRLLIGHDAINVLHRWDFRALDRHMNTITKGANQ
jgi:hypothetical protein